ncbi:hypothetical protein [Frankia sp. Cas3]|uniref:hypothetical protein n=1 Tax=Frankia sp. Cas3 TaxID=3073926 RepID=UPI003A0FFA4B
MGTGGFVSRDSVGLPLTSGISANRYVYGNANPLAYNDPSGHNPLAMLFAAVPLAEILPPVAAAAAIVIEACLDCKSSKRRLS